MQAQGLNAARSVFIQQISGGKAKDEKSLQGTINKNVYQKFNENLKNPIVFLNIIQDTQNEVFRGKDGKIDTNQDLRNKMLAGFVESQKELFKCEVGGKDFKEKPQTLELCSYYLDYIKGNINKDGLRDKINNSDVSRPAKEKALKFIEEIDKNASAPSSSAVNSVAKNTMAPPKPAAPSPAFTQTSNVSSNSSKASSSTSNAPKAFADVKKKILEKVKEEKAKGANEREMAMIVRDLSFNVITDNKTSEDFKNDREFVLELGNFIGGMAFGWASKELSLDKDFVLEMIQIAVNQGMNSKERNVNLHPLTGPHAKEFRQDIEFMRKAVQIHPQLVNYAEGDCKDKLIAEMQKNKT